MAIFPMCNLEKISYSSCGHDELRLIAYCHFARNDPFHQCFGVQTVKRERTVDSERCSECSKPAG
ncbi:hypothetical protein HOY82DRAFT_256839 [Tuber indicum]|nr:hypothetical protein HOY82DRAFT_256839 [Tuber indicum]